ncbi:hypothetical protein AQ616_02330 [Oceanobacillus sp. E9]|nr:hypothetical protein AQ616_02330 [Oceanobacillus sp. E9]
MNLTLLAITLFLVLVSNFSIILILKNKIEKTILNFLSSIVILPGIPLFWLMIYTNLPSNDFLYFYFPLLITVYLILMFTIRLMKLIKRDKLIS